MSKKLIEQLNYLEPELQSLDQSDLFTRVMISGFYWQKKYLELHDKVKNMPRFTFLSPKEGGVKRYLDKVGNWIERHDVVESSENTIEFAPELSSDEIRASIEQHRQRITSLQSENTTLRSQVESLLAVVAAKDEALDSIKEKSTQLTLTESLTAAVDGQVYAINNISVKARALKPSDVELVEVGTVDHGSMIELIPGASSIVNFRDKVYILKQKEGANVST